MHSPSLAPTRFRGGSRPLSRGRRRLLVVATYLGFAAFLGVLYAGYTAQPRWPLPLARLAMYAAGNPDAWASLREPALFVPWLTFVPGSLPSAVVAWTEPDLDDHDL